TAGAAAAVREEGRRAAASRARRSAAEPQRRRRGCAERDLLARAHGATRITAAERQLVQALRSLSRRSRRAGRVASAQGHGGGALDEPVCVGVVSIGKRFVG